MSSLNRLIALVNQGDNVYNVKLKTYSNGTQTLFKYNYMIKSGFSSYKTKKIKENNFNHNNYQYYKNMIRTKANVIDLAFENGHHNGGWQYFITFTFNPEKINSFNYNDVSRLLSKWLIVQRRNNPDLKYIIIPELHKSGRVHYHGIVSNVNSWTLVPKKYKSGRLVKTKSNNQVYELFNYKYGFTDVSKIDNLEAISVYISKYITKDLIKLGYKKRYWASRNLVRPKLQYCCFNEETSELYIKEGEFSLINKKHRDYSPLIYQSKSHV